MINNIRMKTKIISPASTTVSIMPFFCILFSIIYLFHSPRILKSINNKLSINLVLAISSSFVSSIFFLFFIFSASCKNYSLILFLKQIQIFNLYFSPKSSTLLFSSISKLRHVLLQCSHSQFGPQAHGLGIFIQITSLYGIVISFHECFFIRA